MYFILHSAISLYSNIKHDFLVTSHCEKWQLPLWGEKFSVKYTARVTIPRELTSPDLIPTFWIKVAVARIELTLAGLRKQLKWLLQMGNGLKKL